MNAPSKEPVPNSSAFKNALLAIHPDITSAQHEMLKAHCLAESHCLTATQLAAAAGYKNHGAINLHYGNLGKTLAQHLGFSWVMFSKGEPVWTSVLATGAAPSASSPDQHFVWKMRPELVEALMSLPWGLNSGVHPTTDQTEQ
jgi:hypothetical protein